MELYQLNETIWYSAYEEKRDRPTLGYIKGRTMTEVIFGSAIN